MNINELVEKANKENVTITKSDSNQIVLEIKSFKEAELFGSNHWGISKIEDLYHAYIAKDDKQYFIFDFNKDPKDDNFLIGVTLDNNKKIKHAFNQEVDRVEDANLPKVFVDSVLTKKSKSKFKM